MLTLSHRPSTAIVVVDRYFSSRMRFRTLGRTPVVVGGAGVAPDVEAASVRYPDYLAVDCIDWVVAVDFLG